jgi:putative sigma-54 modulation protein
MKIIVNGRNIELTDAIKAFVTDKFKRLEQHFDFIQEVHVFVGVEKNPRIQEKHHAEATIHVNGAVFRLEAASTDLYASIDLLVDKAHRSLDKHKTKLLHRNKAGRSAHGTSIRKIGAASEGSSEQVADERDEDDASEVYLYVESDADDDDDEILKEVNAAS